MFELLNAFYLLA